MSIKNTAHPTYKLTHVNSLHFCLDKAQIWKHHSYAVASLYATRVSSKSESNKHMQLLQSGTPNL